MSGTFETRDGSGTLWPNDRKQNDSQPDFTGPARVNGVLCRVAAWRRVTGKGRAFLSLKFTPDLLRADPVEAAAQPSSPQRAANDEFDDAIPF